MNNVHVSEVKLQAYIDSQGMDTYTALADILTSESDEWRAKDLKNTVTITRHKGLFDDIANSVYVNNEIYIIDLYHEQKKAIDRLYNILRSFPTYIVAFSEGFESGLGKWISSNVTQSNTQARTGTYSAKLYSATTTPTMYTQKFNEITPDSIAFAVYCDFDLTKADSFTYIIRARRINLNNMFIIELNKDTTGKIYIIIGSGKSVQITNKTWRYCEIKGIDYVNQHFDFYVDGILKYSSVAFAYHAHSIDLFQIYLSALPTLSTAPTLYIDDISFSEINTGSEDILKIGTPAYLGKYKNNLFHWRIPVTVNKNISVI